MIVAATPGWRAVFTLPGIGGVSRQVAFWGIEDEAIGVVVGDNGKLSPAHTLAGFIGYVDPDDDPEKLITVARALATKKESIP